MKRSKYKDARKDKVPYITFTDEQKLDYEITLTDDVLTKLNDALIDVIEKEGWTRRDISKITGIHETAVSHLLSGRRPNFTLATLAVLARALKKRPEFTLVDVRPKGNGEGASKPVEALRASDVGSGAVAVHQVKVPPRHSTTQPISTVSQSSSGNGYFKNLLEPAL